MPRITFIDQGGSPVTVDAEIGRSLMEAARSNGIPGILAECGGVCACATCHVYVEEAFLGRLAPAGDGEAALLEFVTGLQPNSRLACQVPVTPALDGMQVVTPASQG